MADEGRAQRAYKEWSAEHYKESPGFVLADAAIDELEAEVEKWRWVAHMLWTCPDSAPHSARSYPSRLAAMWEPGLSYHDGTFHGAERGEEHT